MRDSNCIFRNVNVVHGWIVSSYMQHHLTMSNSLRADEKVQRTAGQLSSVGNAEEKKLTRRKTVLHTTTRTVLKEEQQIYNVKITDM